MIFERFKPPFSHFFHKFRQISDIYKMEITTYNQPLTKQCPFCAETIQAAAVKCRFCNEFLNSNKARALQANPLSYADPDNAQKTTDEIILVARPSFLAMTGSVIRGLLFLALAAFLIVYPLEDLSIFQSEPLVPSIVASPETGESAAAPDSAAAKTTDKISSKLELNQQQLAMVHQYRTIAGIGLAALVILAFLIKMARLKTTRYEVSADRIEWSRGLLDRKVDNLDMFRIIDLKMRRSLLDCIVGIGTVTIITTDKTDPEFDFEKIRNPRRLYDILKKASLEADRRSNAIHIE